MAVECDDAFVQRCCIGFMEGRSGGDKVFVAGRGVKRGSNAAPSQKNGQHTETGKAKELAAEAVKIVHRLSVYECLPTLLTLA